MWSMLANHLWQSTLFAVAAGLLTLALRNNGAHIRYWLWLAASVKFLIPFSLLAALGAQVGWRAAPYEISSQWSTTVARLAEPVPTSASVTGLIVLLLAVWACGFVYVTSSWLRRWLHMRALLRAAQPSPLSPLPGRRFGRSVALAVKASPASMEPGVIGIFRPVLMMPSGISEHLTPDQLRAVIAHELCHVRRGDNLTAAVQMLVEALFWFHPLVWWIGARLVDERERACDQGVIRSGHDRNTYAEGILNVCQFYAASSLTCAAGVSGADLRRRIHSIMRASAMMKLSIRKKALLAVAAFTVMALPIVIGALTNGSGAAAFAADREYLPIVKVAPVYPPQAAQIGLEGYVIVEYTVTTTGATSDLVVVESTSPLFEEAALESARKFKYEPRIVGGKAVAVPGVRSKITFVMEEEFI